ncbi:HAD family hydrolase [Streptomyces sp. NPDC058193]|uniref:HAD family hydrolase n=1 Tax=Streptomyces sp. NPDC058193 TaxID=3346373 RepID=UPI0036E17976
MSDHPNPVADVTQCVLFDFAGVVAAGPEGGDRSAIEAHLDVPPDSFWPAYWSERDAYDNGLDAPTYWQRVGRSAGADWDQDRIQRLWADDIGYWLHTRDTTTAAARSLNSRGIRTAILSNAPADLAAALRQAPVFADFEAQIYSCDVRILKPDEGLYSHALRTLGLKASQTAFIDDKPANTEAAEALGIRSHAYADPAGLDIFLAGLTGPHDSRRGLRP